MRPRKANSEAAKALIAVAVRGELDAGQAGRLYRLGPEAVTLALLAAARRIAEQNTRITELQSRLQGSAWCVIHEPR